MYICTIVVYVDRKFISGNDFDSLVLPNFA